MTALCAPVELCHALVDAPSLDHPPLCLHAVTFLAFYLGLGHRADLFLLLAHNHYLLYVFIAVTGNLQGIFQGLFPSTLGANVTFLNRVWLTKRIALWTKFHHFTERPFLIPIEWNLNIMHQI